MDWQPGEGLFEMVVSVLPLQHEQTHTLTVKSLTMEFLSGWGKAMLA